jgi:uncharacterized membrane protein YgdD (TMEM256/DUF423 family)
MRWVRIGAVAGFLGVLLGAFGAHGLEERLLAAGRADTWDTAVFYHLLHAGMVVLAGAVWPDRAGGPGGAWTAGIVLFSGSLYAFSLSGFTWLVAVTPFGGLAFLAGWAWLVRCGGEKPCVGGKG